MARLLLGMWTVGPVLVQFPGSRPGARGQELIGILLGLAPVRAEAEVELHCCRWASAILWESLALYGLCTPTSCGPWKWALGWGRGVILDEEAALFVWMSLLSEREAAASSAFHIAGGGRLGVGWF